LSYKQPEGRDRAGADHPEPPIRGGRRDEAEGAQVV